MYYNLSDAKFFRRRVVYKVKADQYQNEGLKEARRILRAAVIRNLGDASEVYRLWWMSDISSAEGYEKVHDLLFQALKAGKDPDDERGREIKKNRFAGLCADLTKAGITLAALEPLLEQPIATNVVGSGAAASSSLGNAGAVVGVTLSSASTNIDDLDRRKMERMIKHLQQYVINVTNNSNINQEHAGRVGQSFLSMQRVAQLKAAMTTEVRRILQQADLRVGQRPILPSLSLQRADSHEQLLHLDHEEKKKEAGKKVLQFWRGYKIKKSMIADPYGFYLSLINPDDELRMLSEIMYGKHVAEISENSSDRINNPYLKEKGGYHRLNTSLRTFTGEFINDLYSKYNITERDREEYQYTPVVLLDSLDIQSILHQSGKYPSVILLKNAGEKIGFVKVGKKCYPENLLIKNEVTTLGLVPSGWDIAQSYRSPSSRVSTTSASPSPVRADESNLSHTKSQLLSSSQMKKLRKVAISVKYPIHFLARSLAKMLDEMPENMSEASIKRISLMLDMANTFYTMNYSRFSFCVYSIIHEISLELIRAKRSQPDFLEKSYGEFLQESESTLLNNLGIDRILAFTKFSREDVAELKMLMIDPDITEELSSRIRSIDTMDDGYKSEIFTTKEVSLLKKILIKNQKTELSAKLLSNTENSTFFASPAYSGMSAHAIAQQLIKKMQVSTLPPKVHLFKPVYYEFRELSTASTIEVENPDDADVFSISAGPIVGLDEFTSGIDINKLVKEKVIDTKRTKPLTIIIDATTALYRNMQLSPEVSALVQSGQLSLIVVESRQKFGLLHSDQSQYGRVMGICSNQSFASADVKQQEELGKRDFLNHIDLQVGAYINTKCRETLEQIKEQHFSNGATLRNVLTEAGILNPKSMSNNQFSLQKSDQDYFVMSETHDSILNLIEERGSFGHFRSNRASIGRRDRISSGASDHIDQLLEAGELYFYSLHPSDLLRDFSNSVENTVTNEIDKVCLISALNCILHQQKKGVLSFSQVENLSKLMEKISETLQSCNSLKGREAYENIQRFYSQLLTEKESLTKTIMESAIYSPPLKNASLMEKWTMFIDSVYRNEKKFPAFMQQKKDISKILQEEFIKANFDKNVFEKIENKYVKAAVYAFIADLFDVHDISNVEEMVGYAYRAVGDDFRFCKNERDALALLIAKHNEWRISAIPAYMTHNKDLLFLKSRLEYQKKLYEIRQHNGYEYTEVDISFFGKSSSSATEQLQSVDKMIQSVDLLLSGNNENINMEFGKSAQEGKLKELYDAIMGYLSNTRRAIAASASGAVVSGGAAASSSNAGAILEFVDLNSSLAPITASIQKLEQTLIALEAREKGYKNRVELGDRVFFGSQASDKLIATRDLINGCNALITKLKDKKGDEKNFTVEFSSEKAKTAGQQQSYVREHLGNQYQAIVDAGREAGVSVTASVRTAAVSSNTSTVVGAHKMFAEGKGGKKNEESGGSQDKKPPKP